MEAAEVAAEQAELALQSSQDEYAVSLGAARCAQLQAEVREAPIHRGQRVKVGAKRAAQHAQHKELELLGDGEQLADRTVWAKRSVAAGGPAALGASGSRAAPRSSPARSLLRCFAFPASVGLRASEPLSLSWPLALFGRRGPSLQVAQQRSGQAEAGAAPRSSLAKHFAKPLRFCRVGTAESKHAELELLE